MNNSLTSFSPQDELILDALHRMLPSTESVTNLFLLCHEKLVRPLLADYYKEIVSYDGYPLMLFGLCFLL